MLPNIDVLIIIFGKIIGFEHLKMFYPNTITHSIFILIIFHFICLIVSEIKNSVNVKNLSWGFVIGMLIHLFLDIAFSFEPVYIFWPLPIMPIHLFNNIDFSFFIKNISYASEFLFLRIYTWFIIFIYIKNPSDNGWLIKYVSKWMKIEFLLFIIFSIFALLDLSYFNAIFHIIYLPSLMITMLITIIFRENLKLFGKI